MPEEIIYRDDVTVELVKASASDADDINLTLYMQREIGLTKIGLDVLRNAVVVCAQRDTRNCVRDWMTSITWDGTPRLEQFFPDVFGSEAKAMSHRTFATFLGAKCNAR